MNTSILKRVLAILVVSVLYYTANATIVENFVNARYGFSQFDSYGNGYYKVWNNLKWGICDADGKEIVSPAYDAIWDYNNGYAIVNMGAKWVKTSTPKGVTDIEKERNFKKIWVYDNEFATAYVYEPTMKQIYKLVGGKYGLINKEGNEVVPPIYDELFFTSENGIIKVKSNNKYGYIDFNGNYITEIKYDDACDFCDGMAMVNIGGTLNKRGRITGGKYGFINVLGDEIVKVKYNNANPYDGGLATVKEDSYWIIIDKSGKKIGDKTFEQLGVFSNGRASYNEMGKYGYIDNNGNKLIDVRYDYAMPYSEGIARVKHGWSWGYININCENVTYFDFQEAGDFKDGIAKVKKNSKWGYIDKSGKEIVPIKYTTIAEFDKNGIAKVKVGLKWGLISKSGEEIVSAKYQSIEP
ncbi:MAG: WG repeat-containing protein, partial [Bacteroidales bacterium]|nr:WG repeat-containing protein [Bacteroidales bacterium]